MSDGVTMTRKEFRRLFYDSLVGRVQEKIHQSLQDELKHKLHRDMVALHEATAAENEADANLVKLYDHIRKAERMVAKIMREPPERPGAAEELKTSMRKMLSQAELQKQYRAQHAEGMRSTEDAIAKSKKRLEDLSSPLVREYLGLLSRYRVLLMAVLLCHAVSCALSLISFAWMGPCGAPGVVVIGGQLWFSFKYGFFRFPSFVGADYEEEEPRVSVACRRCYVASGLASLQLALSFFLVVVRISVRFGQIPWFWVPLGALSSLAVAWACFAASRELRSGRRKWIAAEIMLQ